MQIKAEANEDHRQSTPPGHPNSQPAFKQETDTGPDDIDESSHQSV
jgi:hypothetical protein